jgi:NitT/TauT family transport system substrate-binding protein
MDARSISRSTVIAGLAALPLTARPAFAQTVRLRVGSLFADAFAEGYYADALGSFKSAGLDVELTRFANGPAQMTAVLGGGIDIGISDTVSLGTTISKGAPFVLIAGASMYRAVAPTTALCVSVNSTIKNAMDLEGKTVAVLGLHDITEIGTWAWLERNGIKPEAVKFAEIPLLQMVGALDRGSVDAGILAEPFLSQNENKTVRVLAHVYDAIAPQFIVSNWFTSKTFYQQNTTLVKRFVDVVYRVARWANTHPAESAAMLSQVSKMPLSTVQGMTRATFGTSLDPRFIDPVFAALFKYNIIDHRLTATDVSVA